MCGHGYHGEGREQVVQAAPIGVFEPHDAQPRHDRFGNGNTAVSDEGKQHKQDDIEDNARFVVHIPRIQEFVDGGNDPFPVADEVYDGDARESDAEPFVERDASELWRRSNNEYAEHDAINECACAIACV